MTAGGEREQVEAEDDLSAWTAPVMSGRRVFLVRVRREDHPFIVHLETSASTAFRWRHGPRTPSDEEVLGSLSRGVLAQFVLWQREPQRRIGLVNIYNADHVNQVAFLGVATIPQVDKQGLAMEGALLMFRYGFANFPLRKIYAEAHEGNAVRFRSGVGRLLHEEGCLRKHVFYNDRYWDLYTFAVYREEFYERRDKIDQFLRIGGPHDPDG